MSRAGSIWLPSVRRTVLPLLLYFTLGVWLSALSAMALMAWTSPESGVGAFLIEAGPDRVMRRCLMAWSVVFLVFFLRQLNWYGWRDSGWTADDPATTSRPLARIGQGVVLGFATMGVIGGVTFALGLRTFSGLDTLGGWSAIGQRALSFLLSAVVVALLEETVARGIFFRLLDRLWGFWPAAFLISLLFALAHFLTPDPALFTGKDGWLVTSLNLVGSTFTKEFCSHDSGLRYINLTLLGLVLCAFVAKTGTIWLAVGAHAAWVWIIKFNAFLTDTVLERDAFPWLSLRADFTDTLVATAAMLALLGWARATPCRPVVAVRDGGATWWAIPTSVGRLRRWLRDSRRAAGGRVLKAYPGCRVEAMDGLVVKRYTPRPGLAGWRFVLKPSRVRRAFWLALRLLEAGIPTPYPVAWSARRPFGLSRSECLLTEEVAGTEPLTDWLRRQTPDAAVRARVMRAYGAIMGEFHRRGLANRDFKHENVLCALGEPHRLWVVDLDGVLIRPWISRRRAARDLRRVGRSLASAGWDRPGDIHAFFDAYNSFEPRLRRFGFPP